MPDPITATVFTFPDLHTPDAVQPVSIARSFQDVLADAGSATLTYQNDEPNLPYGKLVQFKVRGVVAKTVFIPAYNHVAVAQNAEADEVTTLTGIEAAFDQLSKARAHPPNGLNRLPIATDRIGDWTDPYCFDDSSWAPANDLQSVADGKAVWDPAHPNNPIVFRDDTARVLAAPGDTTTDAPLGIRRFRQHFNAPYDGAYLLEFGADDIGDWNIDGVPTSSTDARENWTRENIDVVELSSGDHVMAWSVTNMPWAGPTNACGGSWALWTPGFDTASLVAHSDASAKVFGPADDAPGMTCGRFMRCLLYDAISAGFLQPFINNPPLAGPTFFTWTDTLDSYGNPWPVVVPSTKVSTDLLTCFTKDLAPYVELWADPGEWLLHAVVKGSKGGPSGVVFAPTSNLTTLSQKGEKLTASGNTMALVRWNGGWTSVGSGDEEMFIDLGAINDRAEVERVAQDQLNEHARLREEITVTYDPSNDSEIPYLTAAFETGATLTVPDSTGTPSTARIQTITPSDDNRSEKLTVVVTVGDVVLTYDERVAMQLKKMVF